MLKLTQYPSKGPESEALYEEVYGEFNRNKIREISNDFLTLQKSPEKLRIAKEIETDETGHGDTAIKTYIESDEAKVDFEQTPENDMHINMAQLFMSMVSGFVKREAIELDNELIQNVKDQVKTASQLPEAPEIAEAINITLGFLDKVIRTGAIEIPNPHPALEHLKDEIPNFKIVLIEFKAYLERLRDYFSS